MRVKFGGNTKQSSTLKATTFARKSIYKNWFKPQTSPSNITITFAYLNKIRFLGSRTLSTTNVTASVRKGLRSKIVMISSDIFTPINLCCYELSCWSTPEANMSLRGLHYVWYLQPEKYGVISKGKQTKICYILNLTAFKKTIFQTYFSKYKNTI